jgi:hypothetical protein
MAAQNTGPLSSTGLRLSRTLAENMSTWLAIIRINVSNLRQDQSYVANPAYQISYTHYDIGGKMLGLFKKSPLKRFQKDHELLTTKAFQAQRNGDIRQYSALTAEAEILRSRIEQLKSSEES